MTLLNKIPKAIKIHFRKWLLFKLPPGTENLVAPWQFLVWEIILMELLSPSCKDSISCMMIWWQGARASSVKTLIKIAQNIARSVKLNSLAPGKFGCNLKLIIFELKSRILRNCHQVNATRPHLISQYLFRQWLGVARQQVNTWANVDPDLCCHMASLGYNELMCWIQVMQSIAMLCEKWGKESKNKTDVERRQTLDHPRSINPNMINHVPQQLPLIF